MPFLTQLEVTPETGRNWRLLSDLIYVRRNGDVIIAQEGFVCDLASIPFWARPLFPVNGEWTEAAVIHDWLYDGRIGKRKEADTIFKEAMIESGVPMWRVNAMYAAVRAGGWWAWMRD